MDEELRRDIGQTKQFASLEEAAFLSLQRTAGLWMQTFARKLRDVDLTPTQYNVLRILRGAHPDALTCGEIGERMVTAVPDVTRLVDRLLGRGLVWKGPDPKDRRVVRVEISGRGIQLLASLDGPVLEWLAELLSPLEDDDLRTLCLLLAKARRGEAVTGSPTSD